MKKIFMVLTFLVLVVLSAPLTTYASSNTQMELVEVANYEFDNLDLNEFYKTGSWQSTAMGLFSNNGLLFIENPYDEYTLTLTSSLQTGLFSSGTSGGYGLLFETTLGEDLKETGYVLQFDRGYGAVIIRPRVDGAELRPIKVVTSANNPIIPSDKTNSWWTEEHTIKLVVSSVDGQEGYKSVSVFIDNQQIIDNFVLKSDAQASTNFTGLRSWQSGTYYNQLTVEVLTEVETEVENPQIIGLYFNETSRRSAGRSANTQVLGDLYFEYDNGTYEFIESIVLTFNRIQTSRVVVIEANGVIYSIELK